MGEDSGEKTEEPTPHKLREARKKGQIAKSKDVTSSILVIVSFFALKATATQIWENLAEYTLDIFSYIPEEFSLTMVGYLMMQGMWVLLKCLGPLFLINVEIGRAHV